MEWSYNGFNEWGYLLANPDVSKAIVEGECGSGFEHYQERGQEEIERGLRSGIPCYREASYLLRNHDVAVAVSHGAYPTGRVHWEWHGREEELQGLRRPFISDEPKSFTDEQKAQWKHGALILEKFFDDDKLDAVNETVDRLWRNAKKETRPIETIVELEFGPPAAFAHPPHPPGTPQSALQASQLVLLGREHPGVDVGRVAVPSSAGAVGRRPLHINLAEF